MILRWLIRESREFPATSFLCLSWITIFAAMTSIHLSSGDPLPPSRWLIFGFGGGDRFGDLTLNDLARGQAWRLITCNFVHYSLIHIGLNLLALYQLGSMVESWYGSHQFIFVYTVIGGGGNLLSALGRIGARSNPNVHSAGGSVVIMGLAGLCAIAGWRSRGADGKWLSKMMLLFVVLTAAIGVSFPRFIDNWGHAGGLAVGTAVGLAHRRLLASVTKPSAWGAGVLSGLLIAGSAAAQFAVDHRGAPARMERFLLKNSQKLKQATAELNQLRRPGARGRLASVASKSLEALEPHLDGPGRTEIQGLRPLLEAERTRRLTDAEAREFDERLKRAIAAVRRNYEEDRRRLRELRITK